MRLNPYLMFDGRCEEAFRFYAEVLGGRIEMMLPHEGSPAVEHVPVEWRKKIMHARLNLGDEVLMGSDAPADRYEPAKGFMVSIGVAEPEEAERVFRRLGEGGTIRMPLQETFWAQRFGMLVDHFGIPWMINCERVPR